MFWNFTNQKGGFTQPAYAQAAAPIASTAMTQPAAFAGHMANNYGAYSAGLSSLAQAKANERSNWYGANAMAEAARQGTMGNIGSSMLGAYGGIGNSALAAWAQNQTAYNKAASEMHTANQMGMSQYGQSRNSALGQLGSAYGDVSRGLGGAAAVGDLSANFGGSFGGGGGGGSGFSASGPGGGIASGSFGGGGGGGGDGFFGSINRRTDNSMLPGVASGVFGGMGGVNSSLMDKDLPNRLDRGADLGRQQIDDQHYSSRMMPSMMMGQAAGDIANLGGMGIGASMAGMNQFYGAQTDPRNRANFDGVLSGLNSGFNSTRGDIRGLYDNSIGRSGMFNPQPAAPARNYWAEQQARQERQWAAEDNRRAALELSRPTRDPGPGPRVPTNAVTGQPMRGVSRRR
jgi:hypothetical protein